MLHNLNIEKYEDNIEALFNKVCTIEEPQYNKDKCFNIVFDFKKLPAPLYALLRDCVNISFELFDSTYDIQARFPDKQINMILASKDLTFSNIYTNIYIDFFKKLQDQMIEDFFYTDENNVCKSTLVSGSKFLQCSVRINLDYSPEYVKYRDKNTFIKKYEKLFLEFLAEAKKMTFKPIVQNTISLSNKDSDIFKLTIACLTDKLVLNFKVDESLFDLDTLNHFKNNLKEIEDTVNSLYSTKNTNFDIINKSKFDILIVRQCYSEINIYDRKISPIYGFLNTLRYAIFDLFIAGQHQFLELTTTSEDYIYLSKDKVNDLQRTHLDKKNIFLGYGKLTLDNVSHIATQLNDSYVSNYEFLTKLLMRESS